MSEQHALRIDIVDSHTGGEPTRTVIGGFPDLGNGPIAERVKLFRDQFDQYRSAIVNEPRGSDVMVGALLVEPMDKTCVAGVIYFNNVGYLGMCGHGTIGLIVTLAHLGRIKPGDHRIETCVGVVTATLKSDGTVAVKNVPSYRAAKNVAVNVDGLGAVVGDIAWAGNWFFLIGQHPLKLDITNIEACTDYTWRVRQALTLQKITGPDGGEIDHIELFSPPADPKNHSRNFVLCPGKAYDRSPCGTGTSAKLACLYEDGKLKPGDIWRQESIIGSIFEGSVAVEDGQVWPTISGSAHVTAESTLILNDADPFRWGIR